MCQGKPFLKKTWHSLSYLSDHNHSILAVFLRPYVQPESFAPLSILHNVFNFSFSVQFLINSFLVFTKKSILSVSFIVFVSFHFITSAFKLYFNSSVTTLIPVHITLYIFFRTQHTSLSPKLHLSSFLSRILMFSDLIDELLYPPFLPRFFLITLSITSGS